MAVRSFHQAILGTEELICERKGAAKIAANCSFVSRARICVWTRHVCARWNYVGRDGIEHARAAVFGLGRGIPEGAAESRASLFGGRNGRKRGPHPRRYW